MSAVESDSLPMGAPGSSLVAYMPHTGLLINDDIRPSTVPGAAPPSATGTRFKSLH